MQKGMVTTILPVFTDSDHTQIQEILKKNTHTLSHEVLIRCE